MYLFAWYDRSENSNKPSMNTLYFILMLYQCTRTIQEGDVTILGLVLKYNSQIKAGLL